jgi:hypothetical protein
LRGFILSEEFDPKSLEEELWSEKAEEGSAIRFSSETLPPASVGLASIRMKRWTRRLVSLSVVLMVLSTLLWISKTHHILRLSTQDGLVQSVELFINDER